MLVRRTCWLCVYEPLSLSLYLGVCVCLYVAFCSNQFDGRQCLLAYNLITAKRYDKFAMSLYVQLCAQQLKCGLCHRKRVSERVADDDAITANIISTYPISVGFDCFRVH